MNQRILNYLDKIMTSVLSRRFQVAVLAVLMLVFRNELGLDDATAKMIRDVMIGWIVADSLRPTDGSSNKDNGGEPGSGGLGGPYGV